MRFVLVYHTINKLQPTVPATMSPKKGQIHVKETLVGPLSVILTTESLSLESSQRAIGVMLKDGLESIQMFKHSGHGLMKVSYNFVYRLKTAIHFIVHTES